MKNFLIFISLILSNHLSFGQSKNNFFLTYGISNAFPAYNSNGVDGGGSYDGTGSFSLGLRYFAPSKKPITFETGLDYSVHKYNSSPAYIPGKDMTPKSEKLEVLTIPVYANLTFLKYLFVNGGALIDFEVNKKNTVQKQSGIGFGVGIGAKYDFRKFSIIANPFLQRHAFIGFEKTGTRQSLFNTGVRIGFGYTF